MRKDLFNKKTISRFISKIEPTLKQKNASKRWISLIETNQLENEKSAYIEFANTILRDLLDYNISIEELKHEENFMEFVFRDKSNNYLVCFEAKGTKTKDLWASQGRSIKIKETPVNQINYYLMHKKIPYGVLTNYKEFVLFKREEGDSKYHKFDFLEIKNNPEKLKEFIAIFSMESFSEKETEKLYKESITEERNFTKEFYKLYHETRLMILKEFKESGIENEVCLHYSQLFLNRLMFIFFAGDTELLDKRYFESKILEVLDKGGGIDGHTDYIFGKIKSIFRELDEEVPKQIKGFNGELFKEEIDGRLSFKDYRNTSFFKDVFQRHRLNKDIELNERDKSIFNKHKNKLNKIIENIFLMASFDFSTEINVNILGHIFEQSISDIENLKEEKSSKRKKEGVFYTPEYVTEYICRNAIIPYLSKSGTSDINEMIDEHSQNISELENKFKQIKILDPACGSGAFLIKSTEILFEIFEKIQWIKENYGEYRANRGLKRKSNFKGQSTLKKWDEKEEIKNIIKNNIFGVDINEESVEITKLSLFLKIARQNKKLIDLSNNIKQGNSLIDDEKITGKLAFNWNAEFSEIMKSGGFNVIIGNPPYVRVQNLRHKDIDFLTNNYKTPTGKIDISILFFEKALDLINNNGTISFISSSQWINTDYGKNLREILVREGYLAKMLDFGSLPVFEEADTYPSIFVLNKHKNTSLKYAKLTKDNYDKIKTENIKFKKFDFEILSSDPWQFSDFNLVNNLNKKGLIWKELNSYGKAYIGNITGYDKAFVVNKKIIDEFNLEKEIIIPYAFKGEEVIRYTNTIPQNFVIYPYKINNDKQELMTEKELKSKYPNILTYLLKFKNELKKRKDSRKLYANNDQWYKHVRPGSFNYIKPKKIHIKGISTRLEAGILNENTNFSGANCPAIILFKNEDMWEILGILNSRLISFYLNNICPKKLGGYIRYNATNISKVPIVIDKSEKLKSSVESALSLNESFYERKNMFFNRINKSFNLDKLNKKLDYFFELEFNDFINEIEKQIKNKIPLKEQDEWEDYFNECKKELLTLKAQIERTENEINRIVYDLYGITQKEIEIIEKDLSIKN